MTHALWNLVTAVLLSLPFSPVDVRDAGITVRVVPREDVVARAQNPAATGWIGCGATCDVLLWDAFSVTEIAEQTRHEVCHAVDWLSDGKMDGAVMGWQPWAGEPYAGEPISDTERFGYWCGRQEI